MTQAPVQSTAKGWMPDDSTFGARLALVRQRMGWGNVREAAIQCGVPPESWRTWERDGVEPRRIVDIAGMISNRTGCDYGWLLAGPRLAGAVSHDGPNVRLTPMAERRTDDQRTDDGRRARLVFDPSPDRPQGPSGQTWRGSTRPSSTVPDSRRRPTSGRPANRTKAA